MKSRVVHSPLPSGGRCEEVLRRIGGRIGFAFCVFSFDSDIEVPSFYLVTSHLTSQLLTAFGFTGHGKILFYSSFQPGHPAIFSHSNYTLILKSTLIIVFLVVPNDKNLKIIMVLWKHMAGKFVWINRFIFYDNFFFK